jgi:hypothetical protein
MIAWPKGEEECLVETQAKVKVKVEVRVHSTSQSDTLSENSLFHPATSHKGHAHEETL